MHPWVLIQQYTHHRSSSFIPIPFFHLSCIEKQHWVLRHPLFHGFGIILEPFPTGRNKNFQE